MPSGWTCQRGMMEQMRTICFFCCPTDDEGKAQCQKNILTLGENKKVGNLINQTKRNSPRIILPENNHRTTSPHFCI